jgi:hypothetical protein
MSEQIDIVEPPRRQGAEAEMRNIQHSTFNSQLPTGGKGASGTGYRFF